MKVKDIMTRQVVGIREYETADVAARTLEQYNIGALPVFGLGGAVCGMITDRDLVTRCVAANREPCKTTVGQIMTGHITTVSPETELTVAAAMMARYQIRRLPVLEQGKLCGMVSLKDLAMKNGEKAAEVLRDISGNITE